MHDFLETSLANMIIWIFLKGVVKIHPRHVVRDFFFTHPKFQVAAEVVMENFQLIGIFFKMDLAPETC